MFEKFAAGDKKAIHPNIRASVYAIALTTGGEREVCKVFQSFTHSIYLTLAQYDIILNAYKTSTNSDEKNTALRSLGRSKDPKCIQRSLALALSTDVKEQDVRDRGHSSSPVNANIWLPDLSPNLIPP